MARRTSLTIIAAVLCVLWQADMVRDGSVEIALGDSFSYDEADLQCVPSNGDWGSVRLVANSLASQNGGVRPGVINLAIDGETSTSFTTGSGRVAPVTGRTDAILATENTNDSPHALVSQNALVLADVAAQQAAGNT